MSKYLISDLHLGDKHYLNKIAEKYDIHMTPREHCSLLINNCNSVLRKDDTLYILGDITIGKMSKELFQFFFHLKKCKRILIAGNHDSSQVINALFKHKFINDVFGCFELENYVLTHIPIVMTEIVSPENNRYYKGNIHGHIHDASKQSVLDDKLYYNVCANLNKFTPVDFEEIKKQLVGNDNNR